MERVNRIRGCFSRGQVALTPIRFGKHLSRVSLLFLFALFTSSILLGQLQKNQGVLIISEVGISHTLTNLIVDQISEQVRQTPNHHVEFYSESLDLMSLPSQFSREDMRDWLQAKYSRYKLDVIVALGPDTVDFLSTYEPAAFAEIPVVICGTSPDQLANPKLRSRFTGTWLKFEPQKTLEVALSLFPDTKHVFVVGGSTVFDRKITSLTKGAFNTLNTQVEIRYLPEMEMSTLTEQLRQLPSQSVVLYTSFFQDAAGVRFPNATKALPMIAAASNGPDFGMSDTYMGHGIVGGYLMGFERQGKMTAQVVSELLDGKKPQEIPIETLPGAYVFDSHELSKWNIAESTLPPESVILFEEPSVWERNKWLWAIILGLSALAAYLLYSRKQLKQAKESQRKLSGRLINAQEQERSRLAREIHDDFSQRLAVMALQLENIAEEVPLSYKEVHRQLHEVEDSASELGSELHALSYQLHSSTLENLGLVSAITAMCREFTAKNGVKANFTSDKVRENVDPDVALCAFRIVQEALRNVRKHSNAKIASVQLLHEGDKLVVRIRDDGHGFDLSQSNNREGLGIRSMEERTLSIGGNFKIRSEFGRGTTIEARVPLKQAGSVAKGHLA